MTLSPNEFQITVTVIALLMQIAATWLIRPLQAITPPTLWWALMGLNFSVMSIRFIHVLSVLGHWQGDVSGNLTALFGFMVSCFMLSTVILLRRHIASESNKKRTLALKLKEERDYLNEVSSATVSMVNTVKQGKPVNMEESLAYRLAKYYVKQYEETSGKKDTGAI